MLTTNPLNHDIIYMDSQEFFKANGITIKSFRLQKNNLIYPQTFIDGITLDEVAAFRISPDHSLSKLFLEHLNNKYNFIQSLQKEINLYDDLFNSKQEDVDYYRAGASFVIDSNNSIKKIITFEFTELQYGNDHMLLVEHADSSMYDFNTQLFDYYTQYFSNNDIPEEFRKPLSDLTSDELEVVRMLCI